MTEKLSIGQLSNSPRTIKIGELDLQIRQLSIKEIFGYFEQKIKNQKIAEAQSMAVLMDSVTRKEFLIEVWRNLPSGSELTNKITDIMASIEGLYDIIYLASKDFGANLDNIKENISFKNLTELTPIVNWIAGIKNNKDKDGDIDSGIVSEKKTG